MLPLAATVLTVAYDIARSNELKFQPIPAIGFVLPGDNLYATSSSLTYLVSAFFVA